MNSGYVRYFRALREYLLKQPFASQIQVLEKMDRGVTGNFEVVILNTGEIIHSKKRYGQGRAETDRERNEIAVKIEMALEAMNE